MLCLEYVQEQVEFMTFGNATVEEGNSLDFDVERSNVTLCC